MHLYPSSITISLDSGNTDFLITAGFCWSFLLHHLVSKATGIIFFYYYYYYDYLSCKEEESTSTWTDLGVNKKKGFVDLWDDVQHVSYINIYLKYKSILLLFSFFGFFYIEDAMLGMRGRDWRWPIWGGRWPGGGTCSSPRALWEEWVIFHLHRCIIHHPTLSLGFILEERVLLFKNYKSMVNVLYSFFLMWFFFFPPI